MNVVLHYYFNSITYHLTRIFNCELNYINHSKIFKCATFYQQIVILRKVLVH